MIAGYYVAAMDSPPEEEDAQTISWILNEFNMPKGSRDVVKRVLTAFRKCKKDMVRYTGERAPSHRQMLIRVPLGSTAAEIIAESMTDGAGIRRAHSDAMDWLRRRHESGEENVPYWGVSASYECYRRMNPTVTIVQKRAQGSSDPNSAWCQACMGWATQLLVRSLWDREIPDEWGGPLTEEERKLPWFQLENLTRISPYQVAEFDKTHQDLVMLGGTGRSNRGTEVQVRFHRMPDGTVDHTGGQQDGSTLATR